jgi:hypothetical protein
MSQKLGAKGGIPRDKAARKEEKKAQKAQSQNPTPPQKAT